MRADFMTPAEPESVGFVTEDSISIDGYNSLNLRLTPGCQPQLGTAGMIANSIPRVIEAPPGFITVADLAIPFARETHGTFARRLARQLAQHNLAREQAKRSETRLRRRPRL